MLKIIVNNQEVDLGDLKGITLNYENTFFDTENVTGSYTIPFNIPMSDKNRKIFEFPFRPEKFINEPKEFNCEIWHSGVLLEAGTLKANIFKNTLIQCNVFISNGNLFSKLKKDKLSERNFGADIIFEFKTAYDPIADDYLMFEVENEDFLKDTIWEESNFAERRYGDEDYEKYNLTGLSYESVNNYRTITGWDRKTYPCLYFRTDSQANSVFAYLTETDMQNNTNPIFYVEAYSDIVIELNNSGFGGTLAVGYIEADDMFVTEYLGATVKQNVFKRVNYDDIVGIPYFHNESPVIITPFPLLYKTLKRLFNNIGYVYKDDFFTQSDFNSITIYNNNNIVKGEYTSDNVVHNSLPPFPLSSVLPDIKTEDFIIAIQNFFNVFFNIHSEKVEVIDRNLVINDTDYEDFNKIILKISSKTIFNTVSGYSLKIQKDENDILTSSFKNYGEYNDVLYTPEAESNWEDNLKIGDIVHDGINYRVFSTYYYNDSLLGIVLKKELVLVECKYMFQTFSTNNKEYKIDTKLSALSIFDPNFVNNECLRTKQKGNSYIDNKIDKSKCSLRLMTYKGLQQYNNNTYKKPLGGHNSNNVEISPRWAYTQRWKDFIKWYKEIRETEYECSMILSASQIKNINFMKKKLYKNSLYFIKTLKVQLLRNSVAPAKAILLKIS